METVKNKISAEGVLNDSLGDGVLEQAFIAGSYVPLDAIRVTNELVEKLINIYKLQFISEWEQNHSTSSEDMNEKIDMLLDLKTDFKKVVEMAEKSGKKIKIEGFLRFSVEA